MDTLGKVVVVEGQSHLEELLKQHEKVALNFWASWCEPAKQMNKVFDELVKSNHGIAFLQIEAEKQPEISEKYEIKAVPCFILVQNGSVVDVIEGADPPTLTKKVALLSEGTLAPVTRPVSQPAIKIVQQAKPVVQEEAGDINQRLEKLINTEPVMLFMKGVPTAPRCGFSNKIVALLDGQGIKFGAFDILSDNAVREGLKTYSNWPTFPQLYVKGKLVGGLDIVKEMAEEGELVPMIPAESLSK